MNQNDVLDDYLEELLLDAVPVAAPAAPAGAAPASEEAAIGTGEAAAGSSVADDTLVMPAGSPATAAVAIEAPAPSAAAADSADAVPAPAEPGQPAAAEKTATGPAPAATPPAPQPVAKAPAPSSPTRPSPVPQAAPAPAVSATPLAAASLRAVATPSANSAWNELQAQARLHANSPRHERRANERTTRWLRLRCGNQAYALELLKVQEVVLPVPLLPLRGTAAAMLGIMNLRGQVVPVIDLGMRLGGRPVEEDSQTRIVVLEEDGETLGLRVSAVEDVANLTDSQIEPPDTARICQISNDLFRGVARLGQQPMILLDATRLLH
ncbi:chemotaxis protein CheW [Flavobacterium sp. MXW15]|uniref:Chemotaxis protein CheW n=1 Tax=Xanthomonas chitinilytica TaxID=2989819 RepID=A0ABT3JVY2_9XANT|nr:chemotaxis protein CheW [Xanthomonas sp. H13-6]MCW4455180.1 chemotaxis protein CheW [Flavobacterium sp. MXW15]MCW4472651.1 chemotaxis protein CheW [Xanthomonas sp. H13-6]